MQRKAILLYALLCCLGLFSSCFSENKFAETDLLNKMSDGLENLFLKEYYAQWIEDADVLTDHPMKIEYFNFDFNDDGIMDYLVLPRSTLFNGSAGNTVDLLLSNGNEFKEIMLPHMYVESRDDLSILKHKTNGLNDIMYYKEKTFRFDGKYYR